MTTLTVHHLGADAPADALACWYGCPPKPAPVYVWLDLASGDMGIAYTETPDSIPEAVWVGEVWRFHLDVIPTAGRADLLLDELAPLAQRMLDEAVEGRDGGYYLPDRGEVVEAAVLALLDEWRFDEIDLVAVVYSGDLVDLLDGESFDEVAAATTDAELDALAAEYEQYLAPDAGAVLCWGLAEHLAAIRDQRAAA